MIFFNFYFLVCLELILLFITHDLSLENHELALQFRNHRLIGTREEVQVNNFIIEYEYHKIVTNKI